MRPNQVFVVRREGKVVFEGTLAMLRSWLAEKRISSDDEIRRHGYQVLEGERLWSLVRDRAELGFDLNQERETLARSLRAVRRSYLICFVVTAAGAFLLYLSQVVPRFEYFDKLKATKESYAGEIAALERELRDASDSLDKARAANRDSDLRISERESALVQLKLASEKQASDLQESFLRKEKDLLRQIEILRSNLDKQLDLNRQLSNAPSFDRALSINWGRSPFGTIDRHLLLENLTTDTLKVEISIVQPIRHVFTVTISPKETYNSSQHLNTPLFYIGNELRITILGSRHSSVREITVK